MRPATPSKERRRERVQAWVQATRIGLDAFADQETLVAWASDLADGRPLGDVEIASPRRDGPSGASARPARTPPASRASPSATRPAPLLVARRGKDVAILPSETGWWAEGAGWRQDGADGHAALPRLRRPEDVPARRDGARQGLAAAHRGRAPRRRRGAAARGERASPGRSSTRRATRSAKGEARVSGLGGFDLALEAAEDDEPRRAAAPARGAGRGARGAAARARLRGAGVPPARVRGEGRSASEGPHLVGGAATVTVTAAYYAGGALPGAEVSWRVDRDARARSARRTATTSSSARSCPGGSWRPRPAPAEPRGDDDRAHRRLGRPPPARRLRPRATLPRPHVVRAEATVMDVNRQAWTAGADLLVHPSERYVGLRTERAFVQKGEPIAIDAIATDLEGGRRRRPAAAAARRAARLGAGRGRVEGGPEGRPGARASRPRRRRCACASRRRRAAPGASSARVADERGRENETRAPGLGGRRAGAARAATSSRRRSRSSPTGRSTGRATWRRSWCSRPSPPPRPS